MTGSLAGAAFGGFVALPGLAAGAPPGLFSFPFVSLPPLDTLSRIECGALSRAALSTLDGRSVWDSAAFSCSRVPASEIALAGRPRRFWSGTVSGGVEVTSGAGGLLIVVIGGSLDAGQVNDLAGRSRCLLNHIRGYRLLIPWGIVWAFDRLLDGWITLSRGSNGLRRLIVFRAYIQLFICHLLTSFVMA